MLLSILDQSVIIIKCIMRHSIINYYVNDLINNLFNNSISKMFTLT